MLKAHQRSKLFETHNVQCGNRFLQFVPIPTYLGPLISRTSVHVNFVIIPLLGRYKLMVKIGVPLIRIRSAQIIQKHNQIQHLCKTFVGGSFHACKICTQSTQPFSRYSMGWVIGRWCTCHFPPPPPPPYGSDPLYGVSFVSTWCRLPTHQISAR